MQNNSYLSDLQSDYICGKLDRKILEGLIFQYLLNNSERYRLFDGNRDKWVDFISWLYPRLSRAVDYYKETGASFDSYINSIVQWSSKEYSIREAEHKITELACWKARAEEMQTCSPEPEYYDGEGKPWIGRTRNMIHFPLINISPRQILILLLKSYYLVTPEFLSKVAQALDMNVDDIQALIDKLHDIRDKKEEKIHIQKERIYSQYYRCLAFQKRLSTTIPGTAKHEKLKSYVERAQRRFKIMKHRLKKTRIDATNQQIADVLNIPKGTVDSALFNVRERWNMTIKQPVLKVPLEGKTGERYHEPCSATAMASTQAMPQMSLSI